MPLSPLTDQRNSGPAYERRIDLEVHLEVGPADQQVGPPALAGDDERGDLEADLEVVPGGDLDAVRALQRRAWSAYWCQRAFGSI